MNRSNRPEVFCKKGILRNSAKFTGKHQCKSLFFRPATLLKKKRLWHRWTSKNIFSYRTPLVVASRWTDKEILQTSSIRQFTFIHKLCVQRKRRCRMWWQIVVDKFSFSSWKSEDHIDNRQPVVLNPFSPLLQFLLNLDNKQAKWLIKPPKRQL